MSLRLTDQAKGDFFVGLEVDVSYEFQPSRQAECRLVAGMEVDVSYVPQLTTYAEWTLVDALKVDVSSEIKPRSPQRSLSCRFTC